MELRRAAKDDYDFLFELFSESQNLHVQALPHFFRPPAKDKLFYSYLDKIIDSEDKYLIIGFDNERPFGYILFIIGDIQQNIYQTGGQFIYINQLVVKERYRGRGFGKALVGHVKKIAKQKKIRKIGLDVWLFNESAIKFFERQGFSAFNQIMWFKNS
jgi:ribosomal protein S18 acetylase RimI-like enzyme